MTFLSEVISPPEVSLVEAETSILGLLDRNRLMSLSTRDEDGVWSNTAFYSFNSKSRLWLVTETGSRHAQNILKDNRVAVTIFSTEQSFGPGALQGLQIQATCRRLISDNISEGYTSYTSRFPRITQWYPTPSSLFEEEGDSGIYQIDPNFIKILDEPRFGEEVYITARVAL